MRHRLASLLLLLAALPVTVAVALAFIEVVCRVWNPEFLAWPKALFPLFQHDDELGWANVPGGGGVFTNGHFLARVSVDELGNRKNAPGGTRLAGAPTILFVGDSATASYEVNDDETIPALLEQRLRAGGRAVDVVNLGVRGWGADQAVRRAIAMARQYRPTTDVVYLFTDGDVYDDNVVSPAAATSIKSVWLRGDDGAFHLHGAPVPEHPRGYTALVLLDAACQPVFYEHTLPVSAFSERVEPKLWDFYVWRLYQAQLEKVRKVFLRNLESDPYTEVMRVGFRRDFGHEYGDDGALRRRCASYFDDQTRFLLAQLHAEIEGRPRVHVVQFPNSDAAARVRRDEAVPSSQLFERLRADGVIDSFLDLSRREVEEKIDLRKLRCPGDSHLCADGNRWIAAEIAAGIAFGATP